MCLLCSFQQPRIISNHRSPFGVYHAVSGQSTQSSQCLPEELALCNTKYLHYFIFFISVLFLVFVAKILWTHKDWQWQGLPNLQAHVLKLKHRSFLLFPFTLITFIICSLNNEKRLDKYFHGLQNMILFIFVIPL